MRCVRGLHDSGEGVGQGITTGSGQTPSQPAREAGCKRRMMGMHLTMPMSGTTVGRRNAPRKLSYSSCRPRWLLGRKSSRHSTKAPIGVAVPTAPSPTATRVRSAFTTGMASKSRVCAFMRASSRSRTGEKICENPVSGRPWAQVAMMKVVDHGRRGRQ